PLAPGAGRSGDIHAAAAPLARDGQRLHGRVAHHREGRLRPRSVHPGGRHGRRSSAFRRRSRGAARPAQRETGAGVMALTSTVEEIIERNSNGLLGKAEGWARVRLGDAADIQNGAPYDSVHFNTDGVGMPLLRIRDVGSDHTQAYYSGDYDDHEI